MSFQFIHMDAYARKADKKGRSIEWILAEAAREPEACVHIETPAPPVLVYGCSIAELKREHDAAVAVAKEVAGKRIRSIRIDQKTLMTFVASHPLRSEEADSHPDKLKEYEAWERDTLEWLAARYGDEFKTAVRHVDEAHLHIHAYVLPKNLRATDLHPGTSAKRLEMRKCAERGDEPKAANKRGDKAYRDAMKAFQNDYQDKVGARHGLARLGAGRRRLTRAQWHQEKAQTQAFKNILAQIEKLGTAAGSFSSEKIAEFCDRLSARFNVQISADDVAPDFIAIFGNPD